MATTAIATAQQNEPLSTYIRRPEVVEKFSLVLGNDREALRCVQSVILLVQNSDPGDYSLQNCSYESVVRSALRAAVNNVSVDPALRQAWLIPRKNKKSGKLEANFQFHYSEIRNRAMRTNRYSYINVSPVYEGEIVMENIYSGLHLIKLANGLLTAPSTQDGFVPVNERRGKIQGWLGYSKTVRGAETTVYMSVKDIEEFITEKNPYWATSLAWKNNRKVMEQKTVLLALLRKTDTNAPGMEGVQQVIKEVDDAEEGETINGEAEEIHDDNTPPEPEQPDELDREFPPVAELPALRYEPEALRDHIQKYAEKAASWQWNEKQDKLLAAMLGAALPDDTDRHVVQYFLTGYQSLREMPSGEKNALLKWIEPAKGSDGKYYPPEMAVREANAALKAAMIDKGQQELMQ